MTLDQQTQNEQDLPWIKPMEPILIEKMPKQPDYLYQVKWDGIRLLANIDHKGVQLYTRNQHIRTSVYPEIAQELYTQFQERRLIFDGECVSIKDGKADFYSVLKRDRQKDIAKIKHLAKESPVTYIVFDLLFLDDEWLTSYPFIYRMEKLQSLLISTPIIQICSTTYDGKRIFQFTKERQWEGLVVKQKEGLYYSGKKHQAWKKIKHTQKIQAFVLGVTFRSKRVNTLVLGICQEGSWHYIGKVSSGLTQKEIELITNWVTTVQIDQPFILQVPAKESQIIWVPPYLKVDIEFLEWTHSGTLRSPVIKGYSFQK